MRLNYKRLGDYIQEVTLRNTELNVSNLLGININKFFMPSVANVVGTDMSKYKIVKKRQFACNRMHVGRDKRLPVALWDEIEDIIVSPAYNVFEVIDEEVLFAEYLMMWFSRKEFDRNAWFYTDADVRGGLNWNDFCNLQLPVPSITKQREIVKEYKVLQDRISLNNTLIEKLEDTAQTIYKQWFVDFDFTDESGNPYKSSGGEVVFNEELDKEIPFGWKLGKLGEIIDFKNGKVKPTLKGDIPVYGGNGVVEYVSQHNANNVIAIGRVGEYCGSLYRVFNKCWISDNAISAQSKSDHNMYCFYLLKNLNLNERSEGTGQPLITQGMLNEIKICIPELEVMRNFNELVDKILQLSNIKSKEQNNLELMKSILLSKLATVEG